jgi:hypothetical protein
MSHTPFIKEYVRAKSEYDLKAETNYEVERMFCAVEDGVYDTMTGRVPALTEEMLEAEIRSRPDATPIATQEQRAQYLRSRHTKQLLNQRNAYHLGGEIRVILSMIYVIPRDEFYAELNTREHVPNKAERKLARQEAAKRSR